MADIECDACKKILILGGRLGGIIAYSSARHHLAHMTHHTVPSFHASEVNVKELDKTNCNVCRKIISRFQQTKQDMLSMISLLLTSHANDAHDDNYVDRIKDAAIKVIYDYSEKYQTAVSDRSELKFNDSRKFGPLKAS